MGTQLAKLPQREHIFKFVKENEVMQVRFFISTLTFYILYLISQYLLHFVLVNTCKIKIKMSSQTKIRRDFFKYLFLSPNNIN